MKDQNIRLDSGPVTNPLRKIPLGLSVKCQLPNLRPRFTKAKVRKYRIFQAKERSKPYKGNENRFNLGFALKKEDE
jgi:hypothetical protein